MMFSYRKLSKIMAGSLLMLASLADASAVYNSEAQGKSQAAAVGNLRMNALRDSLKKLLPPDAVKQNARVIRNEVILKVNIYILLLMRIVSPLKRQRVSISSAVR